MNRRARQVEADTARIFGLLKEALVEIASREKEFKQIPLERRKEVCGQIFDRVRDSIRHPLARPFFDRRKQIMMHMLELYVEVEDINRKWKETVDVQYIRKMRVVEAELRRLQDEMKEGL
jgi:hypothetical protein